MAAMILWPVLKFLTFSLITMPAKATMSVLLWTPNRFDIFYFLLSIGFPLECFRHAHESIPWKIHLIFEWNIRILYLSGNDIVCSTYLHLN